MKPEKKTKAEIREERAAQELEYALGLMKLHKIDSVEGVSRYLEVAMSGAQKQIGDCLAISDITQSDIRRAFLMLQIILKK